MPLFIVIIGILLLFLLIAQFKLNAFISFIIVSLVVGVSEGMEFLLVLDAIQKGIGKTLGSLIMILGFGAMLGKLVADSGAAQRITTQLVDKFGKKKHSMGRSSHRVHCRYSHVLHGRFRDSHSTGVYGSGNHRPTLNLCRTSHVGFIIGYTWLFTTSSRTNRNRGNVQCGYR